MFSKIDINTRLWRVLSIFSSVRLSSRRPNFAVSIRTVNISFKKFGESLEPEHPTILLLHGLLGNKKLWEGIAKTISTMTHQAVMTLDMRNHGDSPHVDSHKYTECAADVRELMAKQKMDKAILIGHSMGGRTAMSLSLMQPEIVAGLVIVDVSPVSSCPDLVIGYPKILEAMRSIDFPKIETKKLLIAQKHAKKILRDKVPDDYTLLKIVSNVGVRDGIIGWTCNIDIFIKHFKYIAAFPKSLLDNRYHGPVKFIGGQKSDFIPPDDLPRIREIFPQATIMYIPKTGHNLQYDDPKRFMELVIGFIKKYRT